MMAERRAPPSQLEAVEKRKRSKPRASLRTEMRAGWLAFESQHERRRLAPTPEKWTELSHTELAKLLERAVSSGKVRRLIE